MHGEAPLPLDPAFAPRTREALAAAPATAWAAQLSSSTCAALLAAVHECFICGDSHYLAKVRVPIEVSPAASASCRQVLAAIDTCPRDEPVVPRADAGFSREFLRAWSERRLHLHKHVKWAACLTADALPALLSGLAGCPPPPPDPTSCCMTALARTVTAQEIIAEIVRGAATTYEDEGHRIRLAIDRCYRLSLAATELVEAARPRLARLLGSEWGQGTATTVLTHQPSRFRGMDFETFMAVVREDIARLLAMSDEALAAHVRDASRR